MKLGLTVIKVLTVGLIICGFAAADAFIDRDITWDVFAARGALFWALAGVCGYAAWRYDDER